MATPLADEMPPWRATLLAVPPESRTASQRDLVRGLELADIIKEELHTPLKPSLTDPRVMKVMLSGVEACLLGPFEFSGVLLFEAIKDKLHSLVIDVHELGVDLVEGRTVPLSDQRCFVAVLAELQFALLRLSTGFGIKYTFRTALFNVYGELFRGLDWEAVAERVAAAKCSLKPADLYQAMIMVHDVFFVRLWSGSNCFDMAKLIFTDVIAPIFQEAAPPPWKVMAAHKFYVFLMNNLDRIERPKISESDHERLKEMKELLTSAWEGCVGMQERAMAAADAAGDHARLALAAWQLSAMIYSAMRPQKVSEVRAMACRAKAAVAVARPWLPRAHRQILGLDAIMESISHLPDEQIVACPLYYSFQGAIVAPDFEFHPAKPGTLRTCAACCLTSRELRACAGCHSVFYCSSAHQKAHWRTHRTECASLKAAKAAADADAAAAPLASDAAPVAPADTKAGPSTVPKRTNNKKKKKKGSKK